MGHTQKIRHTWNKGEQTWKNESHLEEWVTLKRVYYTWKNGSHLEKRGHT